MHFSVQGLSGPPGEQGPEGQPGPKVRTVCSILSLALNVVKDVCYPEGNRHRHNIVCITLSACARLDIEGHFKAFPTLCVGKGNLTKPTFRMRQLNEEE